jgi:hypothetical protein
MKKTLKWVCETCGHPISHRDAAAHLEAIHEHEVACAVTVKPSGT